MALPTFVAAGTSAAGVGAVVPGLPAGAQADDILVLGVETNSSQPATAPTGWTEFPDSPQDCGGAGSACLAAFWKRHDGSETDPTVADTGNHQIAAIIAVRGCVATGDPFDVTAGNVLNLGATSTTITIPGDTTTVADCLIVAIGAHDIDAAGEQISAWANADLANVLERVDAGTDAGGGGGFGIATGEKATAGAFGATTATIGSATEQGRIMVALKPPEGGGDEETAAPADDVTAADARTFQVGKAVADAPTAEDARTFAFGKAAADNVEAADARTFAIGKAAADAASAADTVVFARTILIADNVTATDAAIPEEIILISEQVDDDATAADAVTFQRAIVISETVGSADALTFARSVTAAEAVMAASAVRFAREQHFADGVDVADEATSNAGVFADPPTTRTRTRSVSGRTLTGATSGRTLAAATSGQTTSGDG